MKTTTAPDQIETIKAALLKLHVKLFCQESGDPKRNAQRNLCGRTHYVDDDTLRWHKSRVISSGHLYEGLIFSLTESTALDMHNSKRGFRVVYFDVFGTCLDRARLEEAKSTSRTAEKAAQDVEIDLFKHYREVFEAKAQSARETLSELQAINRQLDNPLHVVAA